MHGKSPFGRSPIGPRRFCGAEGENSSGKLRSRLAGSGPSGQGHVGDDAASASAQLEPEDLGEDFEDDFEDPEPDDELEPLVDLEPSLPFDPVESDFFPDEESADVPDFSRSPEGREDSLRLSFR